MTLVSVSTRSSILFIFVLSISLVISGCGGSSEQDTFEEAQRLLGEGNYQGAIDEYSALVEAYPASSYAPKSQYKIAYIYKRFLKDTVSAEEAYNMLLHLYPDSEEAIFSREDLAFIYHRRGAHRKAIEHYGYLIEHGPKDLKNTFLFKIALEYIELNDFRQARVELKEILRAEVKGKLVPKTLYRVATTYHLEGNLDEALEAYNLVIEKLPKHALALESKLGIATVLEESGELVKALVTLNLLLSEYPNSGAIRLRIERAKERQKNAPKLRKRSRR
ncbi:MAG: tetratricopeptide repeat protein [Deltaproteobacteria bacterium]|nr:tetratricopeptide repeat protein [Deltaproteobacteria bacterium]